MSTDLSMAETSENLFTIEEPIITFSIEQNNNPFNSTNTINNTINSTSLSHNPLKLSQTSITVKNISSEYLLIRTQSTKKIYYSVNPFYVILSPNSKQNLNFSYYINFGEQISSAGHKFKFLGLVISPEEKDEEPIKLVNKYYSQRNKARICLIKRHVKFVDKDNKEIDINNNDKNSNNKINNNNNKINGINKNKYKINNFNKIYEEDNDNENNENSNKDDINNININENGRINIINTNNNQNNNIIDTNIDSINNSNSNNKLYNNKFSTKSFPLNLNIEKSSFNNQENSNSFQSKENLLIFPEKNKLEKNINFNKDFGTPKKKRFHNINKIKEENDIPKTEEEDAALLNSLKVEYYKLKNELDNLIEKYYNLKNHVDLEEEDNKDNINEELLLKNKFNERKKKEIKLSQHICFGLFILAILIGFYLS